MILSIDTRKQIFFLNSRELVLHGPVLLLLDAVLVVAGQHPPILLPVVDRPIIVINIIIIIIS